MRFRNGFLKNIVSLSLCFGVILSLSSCTPVGVILGAGATAGSMALEERGFQQSAKDSISAAELKAELAKLDFELFRRVSIEVFEGRVLAVGRVQGQKEIDTMLKILWKHQNTIEVINQVTLGNNTSLADDTYDLTILASLKARLVGDRNVKAVNYSFIVYRGQVFMLGLAQDIGELDNVINNIQTVERVRGYKSFVLLKNSDQRMKNLKVLQERALQK